MNTKKNNRVELVKARVTKEEKDIIRKKASFYGYKNVSKYLIDAAVHENIIHVDVKAQDTIYNAYAENTKVLNEIKKEILHICKFATKIDEKSLKELKGFMFAILNNQKAIRRIIDKKMELDIWEEINRNEKV